MNKIANNIKQRLSMREPLCEALDVVAMLTDKLSLCKPPINPDLMSKDKIEQLSEDEKLQLSEELSTFISTELAATKELFPNCKSFDRDFVSLAFSIATGIGKTRLMAACIAYLYIKKKIRHFFVLAPNLTIYEKLIRDFGDQGYSKYAFRGITEFVHNTPVVITGDNYETARSLFSDDEIQINIFNIAKFNTDSKEGKKGAPKMKRLSEFLGQSYFEYLSNLDDLVILMDEAHRYHANSSKKAINELRPILGLELTATPIDEKGKAFRNIVYEYNLAQALKDAKYVKNPTIAKRKNFDKGNHSDIELDIIKLEDAVTAHNLAKFNLELYAKENNAPLIKPFILVVCKDTTHAKETVRLIEEDLFDGKYAGKVLQMDSTTKSEMTDDELSRFAEIEKSDNPIEIVVHVNMLKEGWDVTNLYTIVPLRAANAVVLIEQTIGRGLRLPYDGKRTGNTEVDKLTVIVHDNFQNVIEEAQKESSLLNKVSFIDIEDLPTDGKPTVDTSKSTIEEKFEQEQKRIDTMPEEAPAKKENQATLDAQIAIYDILPQMNSIVSSKQELSKPEVRQSIKEQVVAQKREELKDSLFAEEELKNFAERVDVVMEDSIFDYQKNIIEIPRMVIEQIFSQASFEWFDLDISSGFNLPSLKNEMIRVGLVTGEVETLVTESSHYYKDPTSQLIMLLMDIEEVDYDRNSDLLYHLVEQALDAIGNNLDNIEELPKVVNQYKVAIITTIYAQMKKHFVVKSLGYSKPRVYPFDKIIAPNNTHLDTYGYKDYKDIVSPQLIKKYIFTGFRKSCHDKYKFDSTTEHNLAYILENSECIVKWLRPAPKQFRIYWHGAKMYEPDFIVETDNMIYMLETKAYKDIETSEVIAKQKAAEAYCLNATEYTNTNGGKPWKYVIIAHNAVDRTHTFEYLLGKSMM